eukprot:TRINITY_DN56989_c0_g1_i1.p1 TRINITY_DN56989_c0_g1~~TRINITY_DN56989_c0_g1_i1.p1  ORF type:complete len:295 (+),score=46.85 TRINITY_DN56989_c0_g1_i1:24-887(+)
MVYQILRDGEPVTHENAVISIFDDTFQRGDGCFEVCRSYGGKVFALDEHVDRLARSAARLGMDLPEVGAIKEWSRTVASKAGECLVRILATRGAGSPANAQYAKPTVFVLSEPLLVRPAEGVRLLPVPAPWHPAGADWQLTGDGKGIIKWVSYAANMAATRHAKEQGFDDAILLGRDNVLLEGPTFSIGWFAEDGVLETPSLDLGILRSCTRAAMLEAAKRAGIVVREGRWTLEHMLQAPEWICLSTTKEVLHVNKIGDLTRPVVGARTQALYSAFTAYVSEQLASH